MINWALAERIQCSDDEKVECFESIKIIADLANKSRRNGILALEGEMRKSNDFIIKKGIQFITDGVDPEYVKEVLETYITADNIKGKELLKRIIAIEGILCIQKGMNPTLIIEKLVAYLGTSCCNKIEEYFEIGETAEKNKIKRYLEEIKNAAPMSKATVLLEDTLSKLDDRSIQRILREFEIMDLVKAMKGASGKIQTCILRNMSKKSEVAVIDMLSRGKVLEENEIAECQKKILDIIEKLKQKNEIAK